MRRTMILTTLLSSLALASIPAAMAQNATRQDNAAPAGGQSGGSGGPMVGQSGNTTTLPTDHRTAPASGIGSVGTDASIGGAGNGGSGAGTGGTAGASGGAGAAR